MSLFRFIQENFLIYNISWEDQLVDRALLKLNQDSSICMITGGGCNVISYLLDQPKLIHSTDINPRQAALLDLRLSLLRTGSKNFYTDMFISGSTENYQEIYYRIRSCLTAFSQRFWDQNIHNFDPSGSGFYHFGSSGTFASLMNKFLARINVQKDLLEMILRPMEAGHRRSYYEPIEQKVFSSTLSRLWKTEPFLSMLGIPVSQSSRTSDLQSFIRKLLRQVFVEQDPSLNPYWGLYLAGRYTRRNLPGHLKEENQLFLSQQVFRVRSETKTLNDFLDESGKTYTHFVLLDHMDWYDRQSSDYMQSWKRILDHSEPGTKILLRSVEPTPDFIPDFVRGCCRVKTYNEPGVNLNDRVNTYAGTFLCEVI